jgi:hypothetical protein
LLYLPKDISTLLRFNVIVDIDLDANSTFNVTVLKKSDKFTQESTSKCDFFTIGHNAICSIYNGSDTKWFIVGDPSYNFNY